MSTTTPIRAQLLKMAQAFVDGFNSLTPEGVICNRSATCVQRMLPASLGMPARNNDEMQKFLMGSGEVFTSYRLSFAHPDGIDKSVTVDEAARKLVMHLRAEGESAVGPYAGEFVFFIKYNEAATEAEEIVEFVDSDLFKSFFAKLAKAKEAKPE